MKQKQRIFTLVLLLCTLFALSASTSAAYKNRWVVTRTGTYYYGANGKKYVGGPRQITKNGKPLLYLFDSKGKLVKDQVTYIKDRKRFYLSLKTGRLLRTFRTNVVSDNPKINGRTYYGTSNGYLLVGLQKYNGRYYYFSKTNGAAITRQWKKINGYYYYFNSYGRAYRNYVATIDGEKYYFDANSHRYHGVKKIGKYYYGFHYNQGRMLYGMRQFNSNYYYFDPNNGGKAVVSSFKTIDGKTYYFNSSGVRVSGWMLIGNKRYYMDPNKSDAQTFGKKTINGITYDFGTKGYVNYTPTGRMTIRVNRANNVVTIYDGDMPVKAMTCSTGNAGEPTPTGTFYIQDHQRWWRLNGPSWGQYCSHFLPSYLFHSVPMYTEAQNPYAVNANTYNQLGRSVSGGCIRLCVADAKWIYDNVPIGSTVVISDHEAMPLGKPKVIKMPSGTVGKDPTDIWS